MLTAAEDFVTGHPDLHLAVVPTFFGLGVIWETNGPTRRGADPLGGDMGPQPAARAPGAQPRVAPRLVAAPASASAGRQRANPAPRSGAGPDAPLPCVQPAEQILRLRHSNPVFSRQEIREVMNDVERPLVGARFAPPRLTSGARAAGRAGRRDPRCEPDQLSRQPRELILAGRLGLDHHRRPEAQRVPHPIQRAPVNRPDRCLPADVRLVRDRQLHPVPGPDPAGRGADRAGDVRGCT